VSSLAPVLTPHGHLLLVADDTAPDLGQELTRRVRKAFSRGAGHGLLHLGAAEMRMALPAVLGYWRDLGTRYVTTLCSLPDIEEGAAPPSVPAPPADELESLARAAPPMTGAEYVTADVLAGLWTEIDAAFRTELAAAKTTIQGFLASKSRSWHLVGRVYFNLAEHRKDEEAPFAFIATYTTRLSSAARPQHLPLGRALSEYAGAINKPRLLSLLLPVQRAAEQCDWLRRMVDSGEIYYPLRWTAAEALQLLTDIPRLEAAGVIVRVPSAWRGKRPPRPQVTATVGTKPPSAIGTEGLLDFRVEVTLDGEPLTPDEIKQLLASSGLQFMRGRWVELDRDQLTDVLDRLRAIETAKAKQGLTFAEAMRLVAGADASIEPASDPAAPDWARVVAGPWLEQTLEALRSPDAIARVDPGPALHATLRPYQQVGLRWLHLLSTLGLGACLADDMGLGKTMQVLALLLVKRSEASARKTSLLVAPASLLANWASEIDRFAPTLRALIAHPSAMPAAELRTIADRLDGIDLVITSYQTLVRVAAIGARPWGIAIFDEAQAIKNPGAKQTRAARQLDASARIALTGTPVENRLGDLWSIFDVINPGLLGTAKAFGAFTKRLAVRQHNSYAPLRALVRPYILRRLKTDRSVIADLPAKTEVKAYCSLSRVQAALYQEAVDELAESVRHAEGIERRGLVLASLMRLKQICNHPSQWLGDDEWREPDSGKLRRLREIAEVIAARQEKVLVFTQFRETTGPLDRFLRTVFGRAGLVLHGETAVSKRQTLVETFQQDESVPYFVISLKAGGFGLNLTAASHVIHFDRWWNPAVENQATDRAFRIGQTKNVLVHKFLCRGTVEEKIDQLMDAKRQLSQELIDDPGGAGGDVLLTELPNDELLKLVALDLRAAAPES
jgi:non-specific serine/threonine protein kinase